MTNYFSLDPRGLGTADIENFHSYFYRYAAIHSTTMTPMARLLKEWWNANFNEPVSLNNVYLYKGNRLPLCGYGDIVHEYLKVVAAAANQPDLYRTTLLPIRGAADSVAHGALRRGRAWCPACMYWSQRDKTIYYDRLIWTIAAMDRCPEHQVALVSTCPTCAVQQLSYHPRDGMTVCAKCAAPLTRPPKSWVRSTRPGFGEADCLALVSSIADGTLKSAIPKSFQIFCEEMQAISEPLLHFRKDKSLNDGPRTWRVKYGKPTLTTMLKRCHSAGVRLVDVLSDPVGAAHAAGELAFEAYKLPAASKPRRAEEVVIDVRRRLVEALSATPGSLDSFAMFAQKMGVSQGFLRHRFRALSNAYIGEHKIQYRVRNKLLKRHAKDRLTSGGALLKYINGEHSSQDE